MAMPRPLPGSGCNPAEAVPLGHVHLVLVRRPRFYLEIPIDIIHSLCLKPRKYLIFLGWCILGVEGVLMERHDGGELESDGILDDKGLYYYVTQDGTYTGKFSVLRKYDKLTMSSP
jgi:hypothetical protein